MAYPAYPVRIVPILFESYILQPRNESITKWCLEEKRKWFYLSLDFKKMGFVKPRIREETLWIKRNWDMKKNRQLAKSANFQTAN